MAAAGLLSSVHLGASSYGAIINLIHFHRINSLFSTFPVVKSNDFTTVNSVLINSYSDCSSVAVVITVV